MARGKKPPRETQLSILKMWNGEKEEATAQEADPLTDSKEEDIVPIAPPKRTRNRLKVIAEGAEAASISSDSTTTTECFTERGVEPLPSQSSDSTVVPATGEQILNIPPKPLFPIFNKQTRDVLEARTEQSPPEYKSADANVANDASNNPKSRFGRRLRRSATHEVTTGFMKSSKKNAIKRIASVRTGRTSIEHSNLESAGSPEVELIGERTTVHALPDEIVELICLNESLASRPGSQQNPISLEPFTENRQANSRVSTGATTNNLFGPHKLIHSQKPKKVGDGLHPFWPSSESAHVRGHQTAIRAGSTRFVRQAGPFVEGSSRDGLRSFTNLSDETHGPEPHYIPRATSNDERKTRLEAIAAGHPETLAIQRFTSYSSDADFFQRSHVTWCEKWRPRRASEVLGNESHAKFIKQWLLALALEVHAKTPSKTGADATEWKNADENFNSVEAGFNAARGRKRPKVMRAVDKTLRRKRRRVESDDEDIDDWIVEDDVETPEPDVFDSEDELLFHGMLTAIRSSASPEKPRRLTRLSRKEETENAKGDPQTEVDVTTPHSDSVPRPVVDVSISAPSQQSGSVEGSASVQHDFSSHLTNTILLVGPPGIGKTAAVHACAEELGWEIFEVYPGVGKRNGGNLVNLVGDIGKNHFLGGSGKTGKSDGSRGEISDISNSIVLPGYQSQNIRKMDTFFSMSKPPLPAGEQKDGPCTDTREGTSGISTDCKNTQGLSFLTPASFLIESDMVNDVAGNIAARQSIILIEEADILFNEDANFWPTVINLIKESMRPVILTCNDIGLIPLADLPLQAVLNFQPCPHDLAKDYLTAMTIAEGFSVPSSLTEQAYGPSRQFASADTAIELARSRNSCAISPHADLRRAINNLQFQCESSPEFQSGASASRDDEKGRWSESTEVVTTKKNDGGGDLDLLSDWTLEFQGSGGANQIKAEEVFHRLQQFSDAVSFFDSHVRRRSDADLEEYAFDVTSSDVEVGYTQLVCQKFSDNLESGIPFFNRDNAMALAGTLSARKIVGCVASGTQNRRIRTGDGSTSLDSNMLLERRSLYLSHMVECLGGLGMFPFVRSADELVVDYEPHIRAMIAADDRLEAAELVAMQTRATIFGGRSTRNSSQRQMYTRWIGLSDSARERLREIDFRVDDTFSGVDG